MNSLPANVKSQRAALPSLFGAAAGLSILSWGFSKASALQVPGHVGGALYPPRLPSPQQWGPRTGQCVGVHGAGKRQGRCVRVPGCLCAQILARGH